MKKIITLLVIFPVFILAGLDMFKVNKALSSIKSSKSLKFYNEDKSLELNKKLNFTTQSKADILLFPKNKKSTKVLVVDSYKALKDNKNSIAAIYVKKGRTQIIFVKERLKNNGFDLMKVSEKYLIPECQLKSICLIN